ncbi:MAG: alpha/beta hydrolase [Cyanobacteria bacterium J06614_10]
MRLQHPDGSETFYKAVGNNPNRTLLLMHGIGADHTMWYPQMDAFAAAGFHVLAPDLFGHGCSSKLGTQISPANLASWHRQINWLLEHHNIAKCVLIGVSMGGVIAQSFVVNYSHKVSQLIVADTFGELRTVREKLLGFSATAGIAVFKAFGRERGRVLMKRAMKSTYKAPQAQLARAYFEAISTEIDLDQTLLARKAINRIDSLNKLKNVPIPALVLVGEDFGKAFVEINRKIATALPNATMVTIKNAMDPSNLTNPVEFNQQVLSFLAQPI